MEDAANKLRQLLSQLEDCPTASRRGGLFDPVNILRDLRELDPKRIEFDWLRTAAEPPEAVRLLRQLVRSRPRPRQLPMATKPFHETATWRPDPAEIERWYVAEHVSRGYADRDQDLAAARAKFGSWTKDWQELRGLRREHAPPEWHKPGRKSGVE